MPRMLAAAVLCAAIACLAMLSPSSSAQQPTERQAAASSTPTLSLDFPGGSAAEYIAALRRASPDANIVVLGDLARIQMAAVQLKNVDVLSALSVLDQLPVEQGTFTAKVHVNNVRTSQDVPDVFTVAAEVRDRGNSPGTRQTTVISMADLLGEHLKPADALTAIQTALELIEGGGEPAQIKFHEETGILICRGSPEQIESIRQVNTQLRERASTLEARRQQAAIERQNAERADREAAGNARAQEENQMLARQAAEQRTKAELLERSVEEHRKLVATLETQLRDLRAERDELTRLIADQRAKAKEPTP